jgi:tripartite-type tricarboxylate transporter receptor subunit TctC
MRQRGCGRAFILFLAATAAAVLSCKSAQAQGGYPNKPVRIIVGYAAGGGTDVVARVIGDKLAERLGQPVVIENRPGGGARIAVDYVATQHPDGYTILIGGGSELSISPLIYKTNYSPLTTFIPLTIAIEMPLILVAPPDHPAKTAIELVAWAKANPDKSNYATTAPGFTLPAELFKLQTGAPGVAIYYKSAAEGAIALMNGAASWATFTPPGIVNLVKEGKLRALAVTTAARSPDLPDTPSMKELGLDIDISNWNGFFLPTGTPEPISDRLTRELRDIILRTEVRDKLRGMFTVPVGKTPAETARHIEAEMKVWKGVIDKAQLKFAN